VIWGSCEFSEGIDLRIGIDGRYIQDHFPGIGRYTYNLIKGLVRAAPKGDFVIFHNPQLLNTRYDLDELDRHPNVQLVAANVPTFSLKEQYRLSSLAKRFRLSPLHSPYYVKPYRLPCPSVVTIHDLIPLTCPQSLPSPWTAWVFRVTARLAVRSAARVIAVSESTKRDLNRLFGTPLQKIAVTHEATDDRFRPLQARQMEAFRRKHGLPPTYILYVGINKPHKNLVHLLQVFSALETKAKLVLAGKEDPRYPQARQAAERLGLNERVLFLGEVADADLPPLYNGATLFVFASLYEGFGLPVLEALACGTPVICSNTSSLPEIVGDAAITLDPLDREAWLGAVKLVLESEALREGMRERGLRRARMFSWEETARKTWEVYRDILNR
jgi:glycosyltransferase involved in cell wall biosynthesis